MDDLHQVLAANDFYDLEIVTGMDAHELPASWKAVIGASDLEEKRKVLQALWQPIAGKLPLTIALLRQLADAVVIRENGEFKLIYLFELVGMVTAYTGRLPVNDGPFLDLLPADVADFYRTIHNGWFENISGGLGLLPLEDMEWLSEHEWGILEDIPPLDLDLAKVFSVFHNAGGGYLCFNGTDPNAPECLVFWTMKGPKRNLNLWGTLDPWIEIGLTN